MSSEKKGEFSNSKLLFKEEYSNLDHTLIKVSEEKLRLALNEYENSIKYRFSWLAPFGVLLTLLTAISTTDFKDVLFLDKSTWKAIYIMGTGLSFFFFFMSLLNRRRVITLERLINIIKNKNL